MLKIDLNSDLGESFGAYKIGNDEKIIPLITSANIACAYHAGDPMVMEKTVKLAAREGVSIGAHPGFPDLIGFGRRNMSVSPSEAKAYVLYQLGALAAFVKSIGAKINHVKPHGALYNMAATDYKLAKAMCEAVYEFDKNIYFLALSGSEMIRAANDVGLNAASEVFADRAYEENGELVARTKAGAMIEDENTAVERVVRMVTEGKVTAITGKDIAIKADSVCVHGDGEKALMFVEKIRKELQNNAVTLMSFGE